MSQVHVSMDITKLLNEIREGGDDKLALHLKIAELEGLLEKQLTPWQRIASTINAFRVFPRLIIVLYGWLVAASVTAVLENPDPTLATVGLVGTVTAAFSPVLMKYMDT